MTVYSKGTNHLNKIHINHIFAAFCSSISRHQWNRLRWSKLWTTDSSKLLQEPATLIRNKMSITRSHLIIDLAAANISCQDLCFCQREETKAWKCLHLHSPVLWIWKDFVSKATCMAKGEHNCLQLAPNHYGYQLKSFNIKNRKVEQEEFINR